MSGNERWRENGWVEMRDGGRMDEFMKADMDDYFVEVNEKYKNVLEFVFIPKKVWIECKILANENREGSYRNINVAQLMENGARNN